MERATLGFFLECCVVTLGETAGKPEARLESYEFTTPIFFSWQGKESLPQKIEKSSEIMECMASGTLMVDTRRLPRPLVRRLLDPPRRIKIGPRGKDGFSFQCSYIPKRNRGRFLFQLGLPEYSLPIEQNILPSEFYPMLHETRETLTWISNEGIKAEVMYLPPNRLSYERKRAEEKLAIRFPENAKKAYREVKDWANVVADLAASTR